MPEITAAVYDGENPTSLVAILANSTERKWLTQLNDAGSGSLKVHNNDTADRAACAYDNIVRFSIDGQEVAAFIIERRGFPPAPEGEDAELEWSCSGRGILAILEDAIVLPEGFVEGSLQRQRPFDWTAMVYDDSSWIAATQIQRQDSTSGVVTNYYGYPTEWPDPLAYWIWSRPQETAPVDVPDGTSYFRKDFTLASTKNVFVFVSADNGYRLWVDGEVVSEDWPGDAGYHWRDTRKAELLLGPGTHQIAVEAVNYDIPSGLDTPGALIVSVMENVDGVPGTVIARSDNTWACLDYPTEVPGMTPGEIMRILVEEAQARGALDGVTLGFTDATDSNSAAWDSEPDVAVDIGKSLLDVARMLFEQFVDGDMTPQLQLRLYNKGTKGSDLTGSVNLGVGVDFEMLRLEGEASYANAALARDTTGALTLVDDGVTGKRKEAYLELASAPNGARARAMAGEILLEFSAPTVQMSSRVTKDSGPYVSWNVGDTILVPNENGAAQETTVLSIAVSEDDAGHPIFAAEGAQDAAA